MDIFDKEFWLYIANLQWWQGLIFVLGVLILTLVGKNVGFVKNLFGKKKRSCGDCALLMLTMVTDAIKMKRETLDSILDEQMNYAEQKSDVMFLDLIDSYKQDQINFRVVGKEPDYVMENKEYLLYREGLQNALRLALKEIRRSFKENGFHDKSGKEFADYVKEKTKELISLVKKYMMGSYPSENMIVSLKQRFEKLDAAKIEDEVFEIYINAKEVVTKAHSKIKGIDEEFKNNMDKFFSK